MSLTNFEFRYTSAQGRSPCDVPGASLVPAIAPARLPLSHTKQLGDVVSYLMFIDISSLEHITFQS